MRHRSTWDEAAGLMLSIAAVIGFAMLVRWVWRDRHLLSTLYLRTPIKRAAGLVLGCSAPLLAIGVMQLAFDSSSLSDFARQFSQIVFPGESWGRDYQWQVRSGLYGTIFGLLFTFLYDANLGQLFKWIRNG